MNDINQGSFTGLVCDTIDWPPSTLLYSLNEPGELSQ